MANIKIPTLSKNDFDHPPFLNMFFKVDCKKIKKLNVKAPTALQKIYRYRNQANSQYYFTKSRNKHITVEDDLEENNPYKLPYILKENQTGRKNCIEIKLKDGHTYNSRFNKNIRSRLNVPESPTRILTITDVDPEFFSLVEGRPVKYPFNKDAYISDIRDCMLYRLEIGYQEDGILQDKKEFENEEMKFKVACENYNKSVSDFESFLKEDYEKSLVLMKEAKSMENLLKDKINEYQKLESEFGKTKREVYALEEKCRQSKMYRDFLYIVSPVSWIKENGIKLEKISNSLHKYEFTHESGSIMSMDNLISAFEKEFIDDNPTKIYFTEPKQLLQILDNIVMQNLNSWSNAEKLSINVQKLETALKKTGVKIEKEYEEITEQISNLQAAIEEEEANAAKLKKKATDIIENHFHNTVASREALKLHVCVKDVFDKLVFSDVDFKTYDMMRMIEEEYETNMRHLDLEDLETVKAAEKELFENERKAMQSAKLAAKKLKTLEKINKRIKIALEPPKKWLAT